MAKTTSELLDEVEAAISNALLAQSYGTAAGNSKTNADLKVLFDTRDRLKRQLAAESSSSSAPVLLATFNHSNGGA